MKITQARETFLAVRSTSGLAEKTLGHNRVHINQLIAVTGDIHVHKVTATHVDKLFTTLTQRNLSQGALAGVFNSLNLFFRFCRGREIMPSGHDPLAGRLRPKQVTRKRLILPASTFGQVLDHAEASHPRNRAVVALGLYTFRRQGEIASMKIKDLDLDTGELDTWLSKQKKFDTLPVSKELDEEMRRWLTWYTEHHGPLQRDWYLVPAKARPSLRVPDGQRGWARDPNSQVSPTKKMTNIWDVVKGAISCVVDASELKGEGGHTLRRSGARALADELMEQGHDRAIRTVQAFLGHATLQMTEHYIQMEPDREVRNKMLRGKDMFPSQRAKDGVIDLGQHRDRKAQG